MARLADRIGIIHEGRLLQELDVAELEQQRRRRLLLSARDIGAAQAVLANAGFAPRISGGATIELLEESAVARPDEIAALLAHAGHAPAMLIVEKEDLEHYFLRLVGLDGEQRK